MAYVIVEGTLKRKNEFSPRLNRRRSTYVICTVCECIIDNTVETIIMTFNTDILKTDDESTIDTKIAAESLIELAKYNI